MANQAATEFAEKYGQSIANLVDDKNDPTKTPKLKEIQEIVGILLEKPTEKINTNLFNNPEASITTILSEASISSAGKTSRGGVFGSGRTSTGLKPKSAFVKHDPYQHKKDAQTLITYGLRDEGALNLLEKAVTEHNLTAPGEAALKEANGSFRDAITSAVRNFDSLTEMVRAGEDKHIALLDADETLVSLCRKVPTLSDGPVQASPALDRSHTQTR